MEKLKQLDPSDPKILEDIDKLRKNVKQKQARKAKKENRVRVIIFIIM